MALRTQLGAVFFSRSTDRGATWSRAQNSGLSASESMPSLTRIPATGDLLLIWNNAEFDHTYDHSGKRMPLTCAVSRDGGETWQQRRNLEDGSNVRVQQRGVLLHGRRARHRHLLHVAHGRPGAARQVRPLRHVV